MGLASVLSKLKFQIIIIDIKYENLLKKNFTNLIS